jgi:hypothetical protein
LKRSVQNAAAWVIKKKKKIWSKQALSQSREENPDGCITTKQRNFVMQYFANGCNATQAAISAGYKEKTAQQKGHNLLKEPGVKEFVERKMKQYTEKLEITAEMKMKKLWLCADRGIPETIGDGQNLWAEGMRVGISAISELNKMQGDYAPEKILNANANLETSPQDFAELLEQYERDY